MSTIEWSRRIADEVETVLGVTRADMWSNCSTAPSWVTSNVS
jgi:hypothetical protein